ncbi:MAG: GNAT family N-acetyltransferase [Candidatus Binatia bacterium]
MKSVHNRRDTTPRTSTSATPSSWATLREYVKSRGVWGTARRLFTAFVYHREHLVLYYKPMDQEIQRVTAKVAGVMRRATVEDLERLDVFSHHYTQAQFRRWIEKGWAWVFEHDGKLIAYRVVTQELPRVGAPRDLVQLEPTDVWVVNMYTLPEYQGLRVQAALITHVLAVNQAAGFKREISIGRLDNESSRRTIGLSGGREMEEIISTRLFGITRYRLKKTGARRYYDGQTVARTSGKEQPRGESNLRGA